MTEINLLKKSITKNGQNAFNQGKNASGAYVMRGNSIVRVKADGSTEVIKRISQVKVKVKNSDKVIVLP